MACASDGRPSTSTEIASGSSWLRMTTDGLATAMATRATSAARAARCRRKTRHMSSKTLCIANTRIDERVEDVDDEIRQYDGDAADDEHRQDDGIVTLDDRAE